MKKIQTPIRQQDGQAVQQETDQGETPGLLDLHVDALRLHALGQVVLVHQRRRGEGLVGVVVDFDRRAAEQGGFHLAGVHLGQELRVADL
jgi:hypothetical protein